MTIIMIVLLIVFLILISKTVLVLYIKMNGISAKAILKRHPVSYNITGPSKSDSQSKSGRLSTMYSRSSSEISAIYKANRVRYIEKPLNEYYSMCYNNRDEVTIKYFKKNPRYFVVL